MVGIATEHESRRFLAATYLMALHAGIVNGITWLNPDSNTFTSHMSGTSAKAAVYFVDGKIEDDGGPAAALLVCFFAGASISGMITGYCRRPLLLAILLSQIWTSIEILNSILMDGS
eukprot:2492585-Pyramimonas_sp.AAC.2